MTERVVNVNVPPIVGNKVTYSDTIVTTSTPNVITNVSVPKVVTTVAKDTLKSVVTGMGEESLPNPQLFKRSQEYLKVLDPLSIKTTKTFSEQKSVTDIFNRVVNYIRVFTETKNTSELFKVAAGKNIVDTGRLTEQSSKSTYKVFADTVVKFDTAYSFVNKGLVDTVQKADQKQIVIGKNTRNSRMSIFTEGLGNTSFFYRPRKLSFIIFKIG
jgi:hypothetical protein